MIKIITIGKKHDPNLESAIKDYEKRISPLVKFEWKIINHETGDALFTRHTESLKIMNAVRPNDYVILLDERGRTIKSEALASLINTAQTHTRDIVLIIGGAHGVDESVLQRADTIISFGCSVFPHQLVRLMAIEQIYRSLTIIKGLPYHNA